MLTEDRSITLDYAKALGIISVVIGHYNLNPFGIPHPYLFHMPLFFFIGGMLIKTNKGVCSTLLLIGFVLIILEMKLIAPRRDDRPTPAS